MDESISNLSEFEKNFNEKNERIKAGELQKDIDDISSFDSQASRINFWKELNEN